MTELHHRDLPLRGRHGSGCFDGHQVPRWVSSCIPCPLTDAMGALSSSLLAFLFSFGFPLFASAVRSLAFPFSRSASRSDRTPSQMYEALNSRVAGSSAFLRSNLRLAVELTFSYLHQSSALRPSCSCPFPSSSSNSAPRSADGPRTPRANDDISPGSLAQLIHNIHLSMASDFSCRYYCISCSF